MAHDTDDYLRLCVRMPNDQQIIEKRKDCSRFSTKKITFEALYEAGRDLIWLIDFHIPYDLIDAYYQYIAYRKNRTKLFTYNHQMFICICDDDYKRFGQFCEYKLPYDDLDREMYLDDLIRQNMEARKRILPENRPISCYNLLSSCRDHLNRKRCLDWRDICDGKIDCVNGDDENQCLSIEMNQCNDQMEFRCRNGLCIPREYFLDGQFDCLDGSDEQSKLNEQICYRFPVIDCEEHICTPGTFSCGDGQCIEWIDRFQSLYKCTNWNDAFYMCEKKVSKKTSIIDGSCQAFMTSEDHLPCADLIRQYIAIEDHGYYTLSTMKSDVSVECKNTNQSLPFYSHSSFFSPFINAYITRKQIDEFLQSKRTFNSLSFDLFCMENHTHQCLTSDHIFQYRTMPFDSLFHIKLKQDRCHKYPQYLYQCSKSLECISKYRLLDGYSDCFDGSDENLKNDVKSIDKMFLQDRYRCQTVTEQVMFSHLGNGQAECSDANDVGCQLLKQGNDIDLIQKETGIQFEDICNSFWDMSYGIDEMNCSLSEWIASEWSQYNGSDTSLWKGNCVPPSSQCDGEWHYPDGRDEIFCRDNKVFRWPCQNVTTWKLIDLSLRTNLIEDGKMDCLGGQDERNTLTCDDGFQIRDRFRCRNGTCIEQQLTCDGIQHCLDGEDEVGAYCFHPENPFTKRSCKTGTFDCGLYQKLNRSFQNRQCLGGENRCDNRKECLRYGSDEQSCHSSTTNRYKYLRYKKSIKNFDKEPTNDVYEIPDHPEYVWWCDRGIAIERSIRNANAQIICLCPPSLYGDRCQYQSHRITVIYTLEMTLDPSKTNFSHIRVLTLLQYQHKTIDHMILAFNFTQLPLKRKQRFYLNYPWPLLQIIHQASANDYTIIVHEYPIKYPYLPIYRLAIIIYPKRSLTCTMNMIQFCGYHNRNCHLINKTRFYCECQVGWYGLQCSEYFPNITCAENSLFLPIFYNGIDRYDDFPCICPSNQFGRTCHLSWIQDLGTNDCKNNGTKCSILVYSYGNEYDEIFCWCSMYFSGKRCTEKTSSIQITLPTSLLHPRAMILQIIQQRSDSNKLTILHQYIVMTLNATTSSMYFYSHPNANTLVFLKIYCTHRNSSIYLIRQIWQTFERYQHAREFDHLVLLNKDDYHSEIFLVQILKRYHQACRNTNVSCFYDEQTYICICNTKQRFASCLNDGLCLYGNRYENRYDYLCQCRSCYYGSLCQHRTAQFGYTLETLVISDDRMNEGNNLENISDISKIIYLIMSILMFIIGLLSNVCSILTLLHSTITRTFIVWFLILTCFWNQMTLLSLLVQIIYIRLNDSNQIQKILFNYILCKSIPYTMKTFTFISKWSTALINISRYEQITRFATKTNQHLQTKRKILMYIICMIIVSISTITEIFVHRLLTLEMKSFQCISESFSSWSQIDTIFDFIHHISPFCLNTYSIVKLIYLGSKTSLTDVSNLAISQMSIKQTCSCSTCTCSYDSFLYQNGIKSHSLNYDDDCLIYALIIIYESSSWCIQMIYELFFKSFWQILIYVKQELQDRRRNANCQKMRSFNKSISNNHPLSHRKRTYHGLIERYLSSLDAYNRSMSNSTVSQENNNLTIDKQIVLIPVHSTYCQTEIDIQTINIDFKQSEINDTLHRRLNEPLIFMNRENQTLLLPTEFQYSRQTFISTPLHTDISDNQIKLDTNSTLPKPSLSTANSANRPVLTDNSRSSIKQHHRKSKQRQRFIGKKSIPLTLATSLHSNISLYDDHYFLTKYIPQLFTEKYCNRIIQSDRE
ncbi:hypothetical protein I4U23_012769 [Adineta vaga]|nr:hypothetical protein I4U23_012769 [Adineta vaga]